MNQGNKLLPAPYRLSFTSVSLRPDLARIAADAYLACGTWAGARQQVLADNSFQSRSKTSLHRMEREIRPRLELLTRDQIVLLAEGTSEERVAMAWLAATKYAALIPTAFVPVQVMGVSQNGGFICRSYYR